MDQLLKWITGKLGIESQIAYAALGKVMALLKEGVGDETVNQIVSKLPMLQSLVD